MVAVDDRERQAELGLQLVLPLQGHRGRRGYEHEVDPPAPQELADHQPRLDRLAQADIVGDQQIDARKSSAFASGGS